MFVELSIFGFDLTHNLIRLVKYSRNLNDRVWTL
jgi:hypothetical protein